MSGPIRFGTLTLIFLSQAALAVEAQGGSSPSVSSAVSAGGLFQLLLALFIVFAAILGTGWLLKRFGPTQLGGGGAMKVIGAVAVGPRERLVLVEVDGTWLIVGVAPGQVRTVHTMDRPADAPSQNTLKPQESAFAQHLRQVLGKRNG